MEPRIQYAKTSDGVQIAYTVFGEGDPLVIAPFIPAAYFQLEGRIEPWRHWEQALSRHRTIVRYDCRGSGLSDRGAPDWTLDAMVRDVEAVADALGLDSFALFGWFFSGPPAIAYAAKHPDRVSHLILWGTNARGFDFWSSPKAQSLRALREQDWTTYTETIAHTLLGWEHPEAAREWASCLRESIDEGTGRAGVVQAAFYDASSFLQALQAPVLVLHKRRLEIPPLEQARKMAAEIPNARLAIVEGTSLAPWLETPDDSANAILAHLGETSGEPVRAPAGPRPQGTVIILFADIADSTGLTERLGDAAFHEKARDLDAALRGVIREHDGTPIEGKLLGDGVLAVFTSAREGIAAALACGEEGGQAGLPLHLGVHAGDVIRDENNVYGGAVNIASRIAGLSAAGEVLVSETVRSLARTSAGVRFEDRGEQALKGVGEAVRVWAVREDDR